MSRCAASLGIALALALGAAQAQQLYRWVDQHGEVHVTDQPPPPGATHVEKRAFSGSVAPTSETPYALAQAMRDSPVTLYSAPSCKEACAAARAALNRRGVPFKEVSVWNQQTSDELRRASGGNEVPVLVVGAIVQKGFDESALDATLDAAGYPKAGVLPPRSQAAPPAPEGNAQPSQPAAHPQPAQQPAQPLGPYAPR